MKISENIIRLSNVGFPLIGFNESNKELILYGDFREYKDVDQHIDIIKRVESYNIGENLFDFVSLPYMKLEGIRAAAKSSFLSNSQDDINEEVDCIYLYLVFNSPNRSSLANEASVKLEYLSNEFRFALDFCCSMNYDSRLNGLTNLQRYHLYNSIYKDNMNTNIWFSPNTRLVIEPFEEYEVLKDLPKHIRTADRLNDSDYFAPLTDTYDIPDSTLLWVTRQNVLLTRYYECVSLNDYLKVEFLKMIELNIKVKKCKNCDKYYVLKGDYSTDYCDRILPGEKFTCKKIAAVRTRKEKVNNNPILKEYEKAYKRNYAKCTNKKWTNEQFRLWVEEASQKRDITMEKYTCNKDIRFINDFKEFLGNK
jgi:hypothetical protein